MKNILYLLLATFLLSMLATSCNKENIIDQEILDEELEPEVTHVSNSLLTRSANGSTGAGLLLDCVTVTFPFGLVDDQANVYSIADEQSFTDIFINSQPAINIIDFVYPLNVVQEDGTALAVADAMALGELFTQCIPDGGWSQDFFPAYLIDYNNSCFSLQYPINLENENGDIVTASNEEEFIAFLAAQPYQFIFPLDLVDDSGNIFTANNVDELFSLLLACNEFEYDTTIYDWETGFEFIGCYIIEFPLDVTLSDGSVVTVNNHAELCDLMLMGEMLDYAYPLTLSSPMDSTIIVNNDQELLDALENCPSVGGGDPDIVGTILLLLYGDQSASSGLDCYTINYPITLINFGDSLDVRVINSEDELFLISNLPDYNVQYPAEVTMTDTNEILALNSDADLENLLINCQ